MYYGSYRAPIGDILLAWDAEGLTGLWFWRQKYFPRITGALQEIPDPVKRWLDLYFSGQEPPFTPPVHLIGTPFQMQVWQLLQQIPYGKTTTYGTLAKALGKPGASQAVGATVGRNPVSILVPCHRVLGKNYQLTGYAGGLEKKEFLLKLEGILD